METAIPATNNHETNAPTTALNMTSVDGKPTQLTGVGSALNTTTVATNPMQIAVLHLLLVNW